MNPRTVWFAAVETDAIDLGLLEMAIETESVWIDQAAAALKSANQGRGGWAASGQALESLVVRFADPETDAFDLGLALLESAAETESVCWIDQAAPALKSANQGRGGWAASDQALEPWMVRFAVLETDAFVLGLLNAGDCPLAVVPVLWAGVVFLVGLAPGATAGRFVLSTPVYQSGRFVGRLSEPECRARPP